MKELIIRASDPDCLPLLDRSLLFRGMGRVPTKDEVARQSIERVPWVDINGNARLWVGEAVDEEAIRRLLAGYACTIVSPEGQAVEGEDGE